MKNRSFSVRNSVNLLLCLLLFALFAGQQQPARAIARAQSQLDPNIQRTWERTDRLVMQGAVARSWVWGPAPLDIREEPYNDGMRLVTYFDKGRMEINDPQADRSSKWFVSCGLLAKEMVSGVLQTGDTSGTYLGASLLSVAGDVGFGNPAPTYAAFTNVASLSPGQQRAPDRTGQPVVAVIDHDGNVAEHGRYARHGIVNAQYDPTLGHNIPDVFWTFLTSTGPVFEAGRQVQGEVVDWVYTTGYPITEAYWARARFRDIELSPGVWLPEVQKDVLVQVFERRVLTYTPGNSVGWQVEMGNTGKHYYIWRYEYPGR